MNRSTTIIVEPKVFLEAATVIDQVLQNGSKIDYSKAEHCSSQIVKLCPYERTPFAQNGPVRDAVRQAVCAVLERKEERTIDLFVFQTMRQLARELRMVRQIKNRGQIAKLRLMYRLNRHLHDRMQAAKQILTAVA